MDRSNVTSPLKPTWSDRHLQFSEFPQIKCNRGRVVQTLFNREQKLCINDKVHNQEGFINELCLSTAIWKVPSNSTGRGENCAKSRVQSRRPVFTGLFFGDNQLFNQNNNNLKPISIVVSITNNHKVRLPKSP